MNRLKVWAIVVWVVLMLSSGLIGLWFMMYPEILVVFQERIASLGAAGWFMLLGIQFVQVLLVFVPGGPVQIVAGALYGPLGGIAVIIVGIVLGNVVIFALVRKYGERVLRTFVDETDITKYQFLSTQIKLDLWVLILFFIPGSPSSALTFIFALTPIKFWRFIALSISARLPGILVSVYAGDSFVQGIYERTLMLLGGIALIGLAGFLLRNKFGKREG